MVPPCLGEHEAVTAVGYGDAVSFENYGPVSGLPKGSYVVPLGGSILESPISNPKRNYIGAFGLESGLPKQGP